MPITKDLEKFLKDNYSKNLSTLFECSKRDDGAYLVKNLLPAYNFDDIVRQIVVDRFDSLDCILFTKKEIYFIEFKSGFVDKISSVYKSENYDCENCNLLHHEHFIQLEKRRKAEKEVLHKNLQLKIVESLSILKSCILPKCEDLKSRKYIKFVCVIDEKQNPLLSLGVGLNKLSKSSSHDQLSNLIKKYGKESRLRERIFFDEVTVMTAGEFESCSKFN